MKKKYSLGIVFLIIPILLFSFINFSRESDIWFLISHGRYILSHGFPHIEMLTMHSNFKFVMQQSGFSIIVYLLYKYIGSVGIIAFLGILNAFIIFFLYKLCLLLSSNNKYFSFLFAAIIDLLLELSFIAPRPQVLSLLLFLILIYLLEKYVKNDSKIIYFIPLVSLILVNMHSSMWLLLFVLCLPYVVELFIDLTLKKNKKIIKLIIVLFISFGVGFINPYGYEAMFYVFNTYGISAINSYITEMGMVNFFSNSDIISYNSFLIIFCIVIEVVIILKNIRKYSIHSILLFLGLALMSIMNIRNFSIFLVCSLPFIIVPIKKEFYSKVSLKVIIVALLIIISAYCYSFCLGNFKIKYKIMEGVVNYLDKNYDKDVRIFNYFEDGSYLEYNYYKPYIDSRAEVFVKKFNKKKDVFDEYIDVIDGRINYDNFVDSYNFKVLIVKNDTVIYEYLINNDNYKLVYYDKYKCLFEKK